MERISNESLQRLPGFLRHLKEMKQNGTKNISSTVIADSFKLNPIQVRKDLSAVSSIAGKPKTGFDVDALISDIEAYLGYNDAYQAVLVGAGKLGRALMDYKNFDNYGIKIVMAFDTNTETFELSDNGTPIFSINNFTEMVKKAGALIGIITVPKDNAQEICNLMVDSGIRAIWNFAPINLTVPPTVVIKNEDMAVSLAILSKKLTYLIKKD